MQNVFSESGLSLTYFILISVGFLHTMLAFIDQKVYRKSKWIHHLGVCLLFVCWILALISQTLPTKMYATLTLVSVIVVETVIRRKRRKLP